MTVEIVLLMVAITVLCIVVPWIFDICIERREMSRETLQLEAWRFTSISALAREIDVLLSDSNYKLEILLTAKEAEQLAVITEGWRTLGRVKLHVGGEYDACA